MTSQTDAQQSHFDQKRLLCMLVVRQCLTCIRIKKLIKYTYASRVMSIFTNWKWTDLQIDRFTQLL